MSKADEMFKELEYKKEEDYYKSDLDSIIYYKDGRYSTNLVFDCGKKAVVPCDDRKRAGAITMDILKVINEKVKELGWIE